MFTPEYATAAFNDILSSSVAAIEREVAYAQSQLRRMSDSRMPRITVAEYEAAQAEFEAAMADASLFIRSGRCAVRFLCIDPGLNDYTQELADAVGEYDADCKKMAAVYADMKADIEHCLRAWF